MSPYLKADKLTKHFVLKGGLFSSKRSVVRAVDEVDLAIEHGQTYGLVGESGCGKSTLGRCILRLIEPTSGSVLLDGEDITKLESKALVEKRRDMQFIFQDPYASLNPRMTVLESIIEPLEVHRIGTAQDRLEKVVSVLEIVGLRKNVLNRYPHEFSGGQRQRVGIARALVVGSKFIVADEPVSALDVSVQSQVLNLIADLQRRLGLTILFISHDLAVVQHVSHQVGVMYLGKIVESTSVENLYQKPLHPYTKALLSAVPNPDPKHHRQMDKERIILSGDVPSPINPPSGCPFHPRCPVAEARCKTEVPVVKNVGTETQPHHVRCHLY